MAADIETSADLREDFVSAHRKKDFKPASTERAWEHFKAKALI